MKKICIFRQDYVGAENYQDLLDEISTFKDVFDYLKQGLYSLN